MDVSKTRSFSPNLSKNTLIFLVIGIKYCNELNTKKAYLNSVYFGVEPYSSITQASTGHSSII